MKKLLSIFLALAMISGFAFSASAVQFDEASLSYDATDERCIPLDDAVKAYEEENGVKLETYRNYFYIPDGTESFFDEHEVKVPNWYNEYFSDVCIWYNYQMCENVPCPVSYCGYSINKTEYKNIYYADIPVGVKRFMINNGVDNHDIVHANCVVSSLGPDNNDYYNENYTDCDNMIFVINDFSSLQSSHNANFRGEWYYYYGGGCYGTVEDGNCTDNCIRDDHKDDNGNHIISELIMGDVDGDGKINIFDASYVQKSIAGYDGYELDERAFEAADVDFNGKINVFDASRIQKFIAGYFDSFK